MRQPRLFLALFIGISFPTLALHQPSVQIRGQGAATLHICDYKPYLDCWYARPHNYCRLPSGTNYRINKNKIYIAGKVAQIIYYLTKNCYDKEPAWAQNLRYYYGNKGVNCGTKSGQYRCVLDIDENQWRIINP